MKLLKLNALFIAAGFAAGAAAGGVDVGPVRTEVDDRDSGFGGGGAWVGLWKFDCARGGGGIWSAAYAGELLVFGGVSRVSSGNVSYAAASDGSGIYL